MMAVAVFLIAVFTLIATVTAIILSYQRNTKKIARNTSHVSDRDILLHLASPQGNFSSPTELSSFFGIKKGEMKRRLSTLLFRHAIKQYGSGVVPNYTLREPLPDYPASFLSADLDLNLLKALFEKYDYILSRAIMIYETGRSILDIEKFLKPYLANKTIRKVQDHYGDRKYVLATEYRTINNGPGIANVEDDEDTLTLEVLEFARLHDGKVTIEDLVREKHMVRQEAQLKLEQLEKAELLQLALDHLGKPEFLLADTNTEIGQSPLQTDQ